MKFKGMKQAGFSLVELMVVVGIIGILAAIAVPKLQQFTAKSKQSEARVNLKTIDTMQQAYFAENSTYAAIATVGYTKPTSAKYNYTDATVGSATGYKAQAAWATGRLCPNDAHTDTWTIDEKSIIENPTKGADEC
jgi:type IV pilus assembly protein PilA